MINFDYQGFDFGNKFLVGNATGFASLGALQTYSFVTLFYPSTLVVTNSIFVLFLLFRRKVISRT